MVQRLRSEGASSIFWLDTFGWVDTDLNSDRLTEDQDFVLKSKSLACGARSTANATSRRRQSKRHRLNIEGSQHVAINLHLRVRKCLAQNAGECTFLPLETCQVELNHPNFDGLLDIGKD